MERIGSWSVHGVVFELAVFEDEEYGSAEGEGMHFYRG
jgi:hypothetical protein